jgi:hypothetical protein
MDEAILLKMAGSSHALEEFAAANPDNVQVATRRGFAGDAEFLALIGLAGITIKSVLDLIIAIIRQHDAVEVSYKGRTVKGVALEDAKAALEDLLQISVDEDDSQ